MTRRNQWVTPQAKAKLCETRRRRNQERWYRSLAKDPMFYVAPERVDLLLHYALCIALIEEPEPIRYNWHRR